MWRVCVYRALSVRLIRLSGCIGATGARHLRASGGSPFDLVRGGVLASRRFAIALSNAGHLAPPRSAVVRTVWLAGALLDLAQIKLPEIQSRCGVEHAGADQA